MAGTYRTCNASVRHSSRAIGRGMILDGTNRWKEPAAVCATVLLRQRFALLWQRRRERSRYLQVTGTPCLPEKMVCCAVFGGFRLPSSVVIQIMHIS